MEIKDLFDDPFPMSDADKYIEAYQARFESVEALVIYLTTTTDPWTTIRRDVIGIPGHMQSRMYWKLIEAGHSIPPITRFEDLSAFRQSVLLILQNEPGQPMGPHLVAEKLGKRHIGSVSSALNAIYSACTGLMSGSEDTYVWPVDAWMWNVSNLRPIPVEVQLENPMAAWLRAQAEPVLKEIESLQIQITEEAQALELKRARMLELTRRAAALKQAAERSENATAILATFDITLPQVSLGGKLT
ncbi:hypothetical protein KC571_00890 [candidate division WWE3 bacterium]|uniref:Uncharacterized protein n=1 Tax=candidate division WWE3 bacterium TaxID=2053526 RepID=A0A955RPW3_UNCKA|nr:hypothetical protein [candidate division WWE3 bacterium]